MASVWVPERVARYATSGRYRPSSSAGPLTSTHRRACPLGDVAELERTDECSVQFGVDRNGACPAALPLSHSDGRPVPRKRQIPCLDRQRLGDPESGPSHDRQECLTLISC